MHIIRLATLTLTSWVTIVLAAPMPAPQFSDPGDQPMPYAEDTPLTPSRVDAHAMLLDTYYKGQDGTKASNGLGTYEKSVTGATLLNPLGSSGQSNGATTYSSDSGSITYGKGGVKPVGPKSSGKKAGIEKVPPGIPHSQDFGPGMGWTQGTPQNFGPGTGW